MLQLKKKGDDFMQNAALISQSLFPYFEKAGTLMKFQPHQQIYFQGDVSSDFYFIKRGRVRAYLMNRNGQEITLEIVERGRVFGESSFFSQSQRLTSIEAITEVELIACDYRALLPYLQQSPELLTTIFELLAKTTKNLSYQVRRLCFLTAGQKIADFLLWMTENPIAEHGITESTLPYTHQEVAECVHLSRITVTRFLNDFKNNGWVDLKYRRICIINRTALIDYVNENL